MAANNYLKLASYRRVSLGDFEVAPRVESQIFPFNSQSSVSRMRALAALHAAMRPEPGVELKVSIWRAEPGYVFPVIGELEQAGEEAGGLS